MILVEISQSASLPVFSTITLYQGFHQSHAISYLLLAHRLLFLEYSANIPLSSPLSPYIAYVFQPFRRGPLFHERLCFDDIAYIISLTATSVAGVLSRLCPLVPCHIHEREHLSTLVSPYRTRALALVATINKYDEHSSRLTYVICPTVTSTRP